MTSNMTMTAISICNFLKLIVKSTVEHYTEDFKLDIKIFKRYAKEAQETGKPVSMLWFCRSCGTYLCPEEDAYKKDNSERLIHIDSNLAAVVEANETEQGYYASTVSQHDKATNEMLSFRQIAESLEAVGDNYKYQSTNNILTSRTKAERNYIVRLIKMYCDDTKYLSGAMPQSEYPFCVQNVDALNQRDAQWSEIKEYLAQDENRNKLDVILGFVPDAESDKTLILHSIEEKGKAMSDSEIEKAYNLLFGDCSNG